MESLKKQAGITMTHVAYKGAMPCVQDIMGGQLDAGWGDVLSTVKLIQSGQMKALAYSGPVRVPLLPDVPTMTELGYTFKNYAWYGFFAPAKTPPAIVQRLNAEINRALQDPAMLKRLEDLGFSKSQLPLTTPEQFSATIRKDLQDWGTLIKSVGITLD